MDINDRATHPEPVDKPYSTHVDNGSGDEGPKPGQYFITLRRLSDGQLEGSWHPEVTKYLDKWVDTRVEKRLKADRKRILDRVEEEVLNSKIRLGGIHGAKTPADIIQATIGTTQALSIEILDRIRKEELK